MRPPNKPGNLVAYVVSDSSKNKACSFRIISMSLSSRIRLGVAGTDQKVVVAPADGSRDKPFEIKLPNPEGVSNYQANGMGWRTTQA
jgi:hypothetical protein